VDQDSILAQTLNTSTQALSIGVPSGVSVRSIDDNSPAATAFKKLGDLPKRWLITRVNGNAVSNPKEFYAATKDQKSIKLTVIDPSEMKRTEREVSFP
jgi:S1-C subfamily serine protease